MDLNHLEIKTLNQRDEIIKEFHKNINQINTYLSTFNPNLGAEKFLFEIKDEISNIDIKLSQNRKELQEANHNFKEIKKKRYTKFIDFFQIMEKSIHQIYSKLSSTSNQPLGGSAFLNLENSLNPFLGGISFSVIPPSKRHRTINSLSGGEQTLAILALLFSINKALPSPCIIMDEIDAPLDKKHVLSLSNFIKSQSFNQQIILISHKEEVFFESDVLIGVTRSNMNSTSMNYYLPLSEIMKKKNYLMND